MERFIQGNGRAVLNVCGCGKLHFTYGPITLHFDQDEFLRFADEVTHTAAHLWDPAYRCDPAPVLGQNSTRCH